MKTVKLLAALAVPAMFAACTSEDIVSDNSQMVQKEVVGAELVGTGISLNVTSGDASSRMVNENGKLKWTETDLLGLGWLLTEKNEPTKPQDPAKGPATSNVWANNMFQIEGDEEKVFTTKGNIYAGWQFAYFPYEYQDFPGSLKYITVNPDQKTMDMEERYSQNFHVSARQFITKDDLVDNQLTKEFTVLNATNILYMTTKPVEGSVFEAGKSLANLEITSVTINTGKEVFTDKALLLAKNLPVQGEGEFTNNMKNWIKTYKTDGETEGRNVSLTTKIDAGYLVSNGAGANRIMPIALPTYQAVDLDKAKVSIEIEAGAGKFTVEYIDEATEENAEAVAKNNEVIEKLVAAFAENGGMTKWTNFVQLGEIQLYDAIFAPDFKNVNADNWAAKVTLADYLNIAPVFELESGAEIVLSSKLVLPTNGVTVEGTSNNKFVVNSSYTWTDKLVLGNQKVEVEVKHKDAAKDAKLTLSTGVELKNKVTNNGIITVKKGATLGDDNLINNKTVYVEFGGFVYPKSGKEGAIAYKVPKKYSLKTIDDMIGTGTAGSANVNTLEINSNVDLKCQNVTETDPEGSDGNPYNPTTGTPGSSSTETLNLEGINLWINGTGKVSAEAPYEYKVKDVVMNGGELSGIDVAGNVTMNGTSAISGGDIAGAVAVEGGEAAISDGDIAEAVEVKEGSITISNGDVKSIVANGSVTMSDGNVAENVTLTSGESNFADVNIYGTLTIEAAATANMSNATNAIKVNKIENKGKLTATTDINVVDIVADNCVIYVETAAGAKDKVIWYSGKFEQIDGIELRGRILPVSSEAFTTAIASVKRGETITLNSDLTLNKWDDLNPNSVAYILDLNGNTLTVEGKSLNSTNVLATVKNGRIKSQLYTEGSFKAENVTFETNSVITSSEGAVQVKGKAKVELIGCKFKCSGVIPFSIESGYNGALTLTGCKFEYVTENKFPYFNSVGNNAKVSVTNCTFESPLATDLKTTYSKFTFKENTFVETFDYTGSEEVINMDARTKAFINGVVNNNNFKTANKVAWWYSNAVTYINNAL